MYVVMLGEVFFGDAGGDDVTATIQKIQNLLLVEVVLHQVLVGQTNAVGHHDCIVMAQPSIVDFMKGEDLHVKSGFIVQRQQVMGGLWPSAGQ